LCIAFEPSIILLHKQASQRQRVFTSSSLYQSPVLTGLSASGFVECGEEP
jgi:hypothetical protein